MRTICKLGLIAAFLGLPAWGFGAERVSAGASSGKRRGRVDFVVPVPVSPEVYGPRETEGPPSSATLRTESDCPPGTWRWLEPRQTQVAEFSVSTSLIVRLERNDDAAATTPDEASRLSAAGEKIAEAFRVRLPAEPDPGDEFSGPLLAQAGPEAVRALAGDARADWETHLPENSEAATAALADALEALGDVPVRLTATVAREHAVANCARIEVCVAGSWNPGGHRAETVKRLPEPPVFYGPVVVKTTDDADAAVVAGHAVEMLAGWLRDHYLAEAISGALLAHASDPCAIAAVRQAGATGRLADSRR